MIHAYLLAVVLGSGPLSVRLADGNTVYLSWVTDAPTKLAWRPNGSLSKSYFDDPITKNFNFNMVRLPWDELALVLTLKVNKIPSDPRMPMDYWLPAFSKIHQSGEAPMKEEGSLTTGSYFKDGNQFYEYMVAVRKPASNRRFDLNFKIADSQWTTVDRARFRNGIRLSGGSFISSALPFPGRSNPYNPYRNFEGRIPRRWSDCETRLVSFDAKGRGYSGQLFQTKNTMLATFPLHVDQVTGVELQIRKFKSVEFKGIQPQPGRQ